MESIVPEAAVGEVQTIAVPEVERAAGAGEPQRLVPAMRLRTSDRILLLHRSCYHNLDKKQPCRSPLTKCLSVWSWKSCAARHDQIQHGAA